MSVVFPHRGVAIDWDWQPDCRCDRPSVTGSEPRLAIHALSRHPAGREAVVRARRWWLTDGKNLARDSVVDTPPAQ